MAWPSAGTATYSPAELPMDWSRSGTAPELTFRRRAVTHLVRSAIARERDDDLVNRFRAPPPGLHPDRGARGDRCRRTADRAAAAGDSTGAGGGAWPAVQE